MPVITEKTLEEMINKMVKEAIEVQANGQKSEDKKEMPEVNSEVESPAPAQDIPTALNNQLAEYLKSGGSVQDFVMEVINWLSSTGIAEVKYEEELPEIPEEEPKSEEGEAEEAPSASGLEALFAEEEEGSEKEEGKAEEKREEAFSPLSRRERIIHSINRVFGL